MVILIVIGTPGMVPKGLKKKKKKNTGETGNQKNRDHLDHSSVKISYNT